MCGIVGYIGKKPAYPILIKGLKRLEYRGYDSAGVAMVSDSFALDKYSNATVYVTRANYTKRNLVKFMNRIAANKQLKNMCVVLNDTKPSNDNTYGYGIGNTKDKD